MNTLVNIRPASSLASSLETHTLVNSCLQPEPALAPLSGQRVVAYGVVGFLRVKDEQKGVHIAEASASAGFLSANNQKRDESGTGSGRHGNNPRTKPGQTLDKAGTTSGQNRSKHVD